jgi:transcription elongation factor GreA-like protein
MYPQNTNFALFTQHLQILDEGSGVENFRQLELWLRYDEERIIYMPSKGVGRIQEISLKFGVIRLALQNDEHLSLRIDEAERLAQPLVSSHFLARTITETDILSQIAFNDPAELLRQLFASIRREVTMNELREMLSAVVSESQWSTWWARARKDSRLIVGSGTKPKLNWNDSISEGSADLMATFLKVSPYDKLEMLKKHATRSDTIASEMAQALAIEASHALQSDPSLALELILIVDSVLQCKGVAMPFTAVELITRAGTGAVIAGVKDRLARKKAVQIVALSWDDWPIIFSAQLKVETDISIFKLIYESLHNAGRADVLVPDVERALSDPPSTPRFYLWLCKEMSNRPELHKYANLDFLRTLFGILGDSAFKGHHSMLRKLFDPNEVVDRAIETLDAPAGRTLLDILSRDRELEEYIKESVRQKVFSIFPELRLSK